MSSAIQLLKDPATEPTLPVLEKMLEKEVFAVYHAILNDILPEFELIPAWRYYNDGKAWLCKVVYKKKTIFWLSLWEEAVKTSFYFTEKSRSGVFDLDISENIKTGFGKASNVGKLIPLILNINNSDQLNDLKKIIVYKKELK